MPKKYINSGFVPGNSNYVETSDTMHVSTVNFTAKSSLVKLAAGASQRMASESLTLLQPFGIKSCKEGDCEVGSLNASIKMSINHAYGDSAQLNGLVDEAIRLLTIWKANNMAFGVVPPVNVNVDQAG